MIDKIAIGLIEARSTYSGTDIGFATKYEINASVYSQIKSGKRDGMLKDAQWVNIAMRLNIEVKNRSWRFVKTDVFKAIESDILFCKENSKSMMFIDECEIGKSEAAKYLSRTLTDCFYVDASQCKAKRDFVRAIASAVGLKSDGKYAEIKAKVKWYLKSLDNPVMIIDEAGDLEYPAFLELKEFWNATDGRCGWYLIGADGLEAKFQEGIRNRKVGYREIFSRFSSKFQSIVPTDKAERLHFKKKLLSDVLSANMNDKTELNAIVKRCLANDSNGDLGGLRRAESILILKQKENPSI